MAFRKRVGLTKGVHLNFSGSGVGIGYKLFPGLSLSANSSGLYCNSSVPGTGFYSRKKVCNWNGETTNSSNSDLPKGKIEVELSLHSYIDENNEFQLEVRNNKTGELVDDRMMAQIKRQQVFKDAIRTLYKNEIQEMEEASEQFTDIYKLTAHTVSEIDLTESLEKMTPEVFIPFYFEDEEPTKEEVRARLERKAERDISSILFWTNKSKRKAFVEANLESQYREVHAQWETKREEFNVCEKERETRERQRINEEFQAQKNALLSSLSGSYDYVSSQIEAILGSLEMPFDFAISYEYDEAKGLLSLLLDLPEIEVFPKRKGSILASGKLSVKNKTIFEQNSEYATCVTGLAFFFAGMFFNVSPRIKWMRINGYTQRTNGTTGLPEDVYVYSVLFDRSRFSEINYERIKPVEAISAFPCRINCLKTAEMKGIQVFSDKEIEDLIQ